MLKKSIAIILASIFLLSLFVPQLVLRAQPSIKITVTPREVFAGDQVDVVVILLNSNTGNPLPETKVNVMIRNPEGLVVVKLQSLTDEQGIVSLNVKTEEDWPPGVYVIIVTVADVVQLKTFKIKVPETREQYVNTTRRAIEMMIKKVSIIVNQTGNEALREKLNQAIQLYKEGNYSVAFKMLLQATHQVRNRFKAIHRGRENVTRGLSTAIQRHKEVIEKLKAIIAKLEEKGFNATIAKALLEKAEAQLHNASVMLHGGKANLTARIMAQIMKNIGDAFSNLKRHGEKVSIQKMKEHIDRLLSSKNIPEPVKEKLQKLKALLETGNFTKMREFAKRYHIVLKEAKIRRYIMGKVWNMTGVPKGLGKHVVIKVGKVAKGNFTGGIPKGGNATRGRGHSQGRRQGHGG